MLLRQAGWTAVRVAPPRLASSVASTRCRAASGAAQDSGADEAAQAASGTAAASDGARPKTVLVDATPLAFRAYFATPKLVSQATGEPVNALVTYMRMLLNIHAQLAPNNLLVLMDAGKARNPLNRSSFRVGLYPEYVLGYVFAFRFCFVTNTAAVPSESHRYKAHRPPLPPDLRSQLELLRPATEACSCRWVELPDYEADDLIAMYARAAQHAQHDVVIASTDKDLMQLVSPTTLMYDPKKLEFYGVDDVIAKFGVPPERVVDVQALCGDRADNIPNVPGIGPKRAASLITRFGSLDDLLRQLHTLDDGALRDKLQQRIATIRLARELVTLADTPPLPLPLSSTAAQPVDLTQLERFCRRYGMWSLLSQYRQGGLHHARTDAASRAGVAPRLPAELSGAEALAPFASVDDVTVFAAPAMDPAAVGMLSSSADGAVVAAAATADASMSSVLADAGVPCTSTADPVPDVVEVARAEPAVDDGYAGEIVFSSQRRHRRSASSHRSSGGVWRDGRRGYATSASLSSAASASVDNNTRDEFSVDDTDAPPVLFNTPPPPPATATCDVPVYETVETLQQLDHVLAAVRAAPVFAFHTCTADTGIATRQLVGVALAIEPWRGWYVPLAHTPPLPPPPPIEQAAAGTGDDAAEDGTVAAAAAEETTTAAKPKTKKKKKAKAAKPSVDEELAEPANLLCVDAAANEQTRQRIAALLTDRACNKVTYDLKDAIKALHTAGLRVAGRCDDTMMLSYVLHCGMHEQDFAELTAQYIPAATLIPLRQIVGMGKRKRPLTGVGARRVTPFAVQHADLALQMFHVVAPQVRAVPSLQRLYDTIERPLVDVLAGMEITGVNVSGDMLQTLADELRSRRDSVQREVFDAAGGEFNIASVQQLGAVLFDKLRYPKKYTSVTAAGSYKTGSDVLSAMAADGLRIPALVLEYRHVSKTLSTYAEGLLERIHPQTQRIHTCYMNALTQTGRLSSVAPNLQNIPARSEEGRRIRRAFVASPQHTMLFVDYSQVELRIFSQIAKIKQLEEAFQNNVDVHQLTASQVFNVPVDQVDKATRQRAKAINFGIIYGMSEFGLSKTLGVSVPEAKQYINSYFAQYPGIKRYMTERINMCRRNGYVETWFGRRCYIPGINSSVKAQRSYAERSCVNTPIQGTSADITKIGMISVAAALKERQFRTRMIMQVHDELIFEAPLDEVDEVAPVIVDLMQQAAPRDFTVPLTCDLKASPGWAE